MNSKTYPANLSYFRLSLLAFLQESHPHLTSDQNFIISRTELAIDTYLQALNAGENHNQAIIQANTVMFNGLHFSKHDTIVNILWNEFPNEVPEDKAKEYAIKLLPECETVFSKYPLSDDFSYEPEFSHLYTELTGTIALFLESHNTQFIIHN